MTIDTDLTTFLFNNAGGANVEMGKIAAEYNGPLFVFFNRSPSDYDLLLNGSDGLNTSNFDIEVYGEDIDAVESLANTLVNVCNGFRGAMGSTNVLGMFVSDHSEDYIPKVEFQTDEGLNGSHFALQIIH